MTANKEGEQLKADRKHLGLTQVQLAQALGYATGRHIRRMESGERKVSGRVKAGIGLLKQQANKKA